MKTKTAATPKRIIKFLLKHGAPSTSQMKNYFFSCRMLLLRSQGGGTAAKECEVFFLGLQTADENLGEFSAMK